MQFPKPLRVFALGAAVPFVQAQTADLREAARLDAAGECKAAETIYSRLLAAESLSLALLNNAGNHYLTCREPVKAEDLFRQVLTKNPTHANANLQMARLHLAAGRFADALSHATHARHAGPVASLVYAEALHFAGQPAAALKALAAAEGAIGSDESLLLPLALTQERMGAFDRAEDTYSRLLAHRPDDPQLLFRLGRSAARAGHFDRAIRALQAAAKLTPSDVDVLLELGRAEVANNNAPKAVYVLAHARKLAPRRPDVLLTLARAAEEAGYYGDSALAYDEYVALQPSDESARRDRALVYGMTQTKLAEGLRDLREHVRKYPADAVAWFALARLTWVSDEQQALTYLDKAVLADAKSPSIRFARAWLLYRAGHAAKAVPDLMAALEASPKSVDVLAQLGLTYLALDKPADAEQFLRRALTEAPEHPEALLHLGRALVALDRSDEAQPYLTRFQQLRPAVMRGPRTEPGMIASATLPERDRLHREIERLRSDLQAHPGDVEIALHLAGLLLADGRREEALEEFNTALSRGVDARLAHRTGKLLLDAGQHALAARFFDAAAAALPEARLHLAVATWLSAGPQAGLRVLDAVPREASSADFLLLRARLLDAAGDAEQSLEVLEAGLQGTISDSRIACEAASLLVKHRREEKALGALSQLSAGISGDDPRLAVFRAGVLALMDRNGDANKAIVDAEQRWPEFPSTYLMQAHILARLGNSAEAAKKLQMALSLGANVKTAGCRPEQTAACDLRSYLIDSACVSSR